MIQFHNVSKSYKDNEFEISGLNFRVDPGEFVFLIGPSGSGKTTVIKMLTREELPSEGKIFFDDFDITKLTRNSVYRLRRQIGVVFQDYKLIPDKTVEENVAFAMEVAGKKDREIKETVPYLLDIVGLSRRADAFPDHLSGGEKQRVAIARAVSNNPRVLIADEPTGNLDPAAAWDIVQILSKINNWGTTVIMSTHGSDIVNTLNKRVIQMVNGTLVRDDSQGHYEKSELAKPKQKQEELEVDTEMKSRRKGIIKVSLNRGEEEGNNAKNKKSLLGWLPFGRKPKSIPTDVELSDDPIEQMEQAIIEDIEEEDEALEQIVKDAAELPVMDLDLNADLAERLDAAGFKKVADLLNAGPDELSNQQTIDSAEIIEIAKAVEEFVEAEQAEIWNGTSYQENDESGENEEEVEQQIIEEIPEAQDSNHESKAQKIKLDLTGKKS